MQIRKTALVSLLIIFLSTVIFNPQMTNAQDYLYDNSGFTPLPVIKSTDDYVNISQSFDLKPYNTSQVTDGLNYVPILRNEITPGDPANFTTISSGSMIFNMNGSVFTYYDFTRNLFAVPYNSSTFLIEKSSLFNNLTLFNIYTGVEEVLPISGDFSDIFYNPETKTYLVLETVISDTLWDGLNVSYQNIVEYNAAGNPIWTWDAETKLPFSSVNHTALGLNETYNNYADWMHANSVVWNIEDDEILLVVRNHDTIYNINKSNGDILWSVGRLGNFIVNDATSNPVDTIWWHPSNLKIIGEDRYLIFDSDARNITNPDSMSLLDGESRYLEFSIDVSKEEVYEEWSFNAPNSAYYSPLSGDSIRLPDGNTLGILGNRGDTAVVLNDTHSLFFTEVNTEGEIVWEVEMQNVTQYTFQSNKIQRIYGKPVVILEADTFVVDMMETPEVNFITWDCMPSVVETPATIRILEDDFEESFNFLANHQPEVITLLITGLGAGEYNFTLEVENQDGFSTVVEFSLIIELNLGVVLSIVIPAGILIVVASLLFIRKAIHVKNKPQVTEAEKEPIDSSETSEEWM